LIVLARDKSLAALEKRRRIGPGMSEDVRALVKDILQAMEARSLHAPQIRFGEKPFAALALPQAWCNTLEMMCFSWIWAGF